MAREFELKFTGSLEALETLRRSKLLKEIGDGRARTRNLTSIYFDTGKGDLASRGVSLRIRKDGPKFIQTIKTLNGKTSPRWDRAEQDAAVSGEEPELGLVANSAVRKSLLKWQEKGALQPLFETDFRRCALPLKLADGAAVEAAFDFGEIRMVGAQDGRRTAVAEVELELKSGDPASLFELARQVAAAAPLRLSIVTKADRGYALVQGSSDRAVRARPLILEPDMRSSDAFGLILGEGLRQIVANENAILRARDPEGVHLMRVALRRLRSAISAFGRQYEIGEMARLKGEMSWLAHELGQTRDWDVFLDRILAPVALALRGLEGLDALTKSAEAAQHAAWDRIVANLDSERYRVFIIDLAAAISNRAWESPDVAAVAVSADKPSAYDRPIIKTARKSLTKRLERVEAIGRRISGLDVNERHELRIRLKRLRYTADFLQSCFPRRAAKKYLAALASLQDVFGELNDAAMAEGIIARLVAGREAVGADAEVVRAGGVVMGWHLAESVRLWGSAQNRWKKLEQAKLFWR